MGLAEAGGGNKAVGAGKGKETPSRSSVPGGGSQPSRAGERYPEGMPGVGREEDVTRKQLKM